MKIRRDLTIVLPHFQNLGMWAEQQRVWAAYPASLRAHLHVVVVDDCSPEGHWPTPSSVTVDGLASLRMYRLQDKKRWNWLACRNLGAKVATTEWVLLTDMDHGVPLETMVRLLCDVNGAGEPVKKLLASDAYQFKRVTATKPWPYSLRDCTEYKRHNDTWLLTKQMFFDRRIGGYDERLSGCYGTSGEFRDRVIATVRANVILPEVVVRYPREVIADASTHPTVYTRKGDPENDDELKRRKDARAQIPNWKPLHGLTPHVEVYSTAGVPV